MRIGRGTGGGLDCLPEDDINRWREEGGSAQIYVPKEQQKCIVLCCGGVEGG